MYTRLSLLLLFAISCPGNADQDGDGFPARDDCDDEDPAIHPEGEEVCDALDNDCDGQIDEGLNEPFYPDSDGDGYGLHAGLIEACAPPDGYARNEGDCDPDDPRIFPGARETCDTLDNDCDGMIDEGFDADGDGHWSMDCPRGDDCDDSRADMNPGLAEICSDGIDNDCDGLNPTCGFSGTYDLANADAFYFATIPSFDTGRLLDAGDIDGDGFADVLAATMSANGLGGAYVAYGPLTGSADLGQAGFHLSATSLQSGAGRSIGMADANGDGLQDVQLGSPYSDTGGASLIYGPITADMSLSNDDVTFVGPGTSSFCGHGSDLADINGDGLGDSLVGAYAWHNYAGTVWITYAPFTSNTINLEGDADAILEGESPNIMTGSNLQAGTDLNGDGIGDILVPAIFDSSGARYSGSAYVVYGPVTGTVSLSASDGKWIGERSDDYAGIAVAMGDVNGDGLGDAIIGTSGSSLADGAGSAYIVYGPASGTNLLSAAGAVIEGIVQGQDLGSGLTSGDIDGDETYDVLVGAPGESFFLPSAGAAYLYFGPLDGNYDTSDADASFMASDSYESAGQGLTIGDLNGDGWGEPIIGAPDYSKGAGGFYTQYPVF